MRRKIRGTRGAALLAAVLASGGMASASGAVPPAAASTLTQVDTLTTPPNTADVGLDVRWGPSSPSDGTALAVFVRAAASGADGVEVSAELDGHPFPCCPAAWPCQTGLARAWRTTALLPARAGSRRPSPGQAPGPTRASSS